MKITCPNCGFARDVDEKNLPPKAVMATCPKCKHRFKFRESTPAFLAEEPIAPKETGQEHEATPILEPTPPQSPIQEEPPGDLWSELEALNETTSGESNQAAESQEPALPLWERVDSGYATAFVQTILDMFKNPRHFFSSMPMGHGYIKPLIFFLIIIEAVAISQALWQVLGILPPSFFAESMHQSFQTLIALVLYPLQVIIFLFVDTAICFSFLRLFKADTKGFEGTFRAEVYSSVPMLLMIIPHIGLPLAMIGVTVYKFLGLKHIHGASSKQVISVMILPMLIAMAVAILLILLTQNHV